MKFAQHDIQQGHAGLYAWSNACHIRYAERANVLFLPNEVHLSVVRRPRPRPAPICLVIQHRILPHSESKMRICLMQWASRSQRLRLDVYEKNPQAWTLNWPQVAWLSPPQASHIRLWCDVPSSLVTPQVTAHRQRSRRLDRTMRVDKRANYRGRRRAMGRGMSTCFLSPRVREFHAPGSEFNRFCEREDIFILIGLTVLILNNTLEWLTK